MTAIQQIAVRHFGKKNITELRKRGVQILAITNIPNENGCMADSQTGYMICDNGTSKVRDYFSVLKILKD